MPSKALTLGTRISFEGETHVLVGWEGPAVRLRSEAGTVRLIGTVELIDAPGFELVEVENDKEVAATSALLDDLPDHLRKKAEQRLAHLNEAASGYCSGNPENSKRGEPQPKYDPNATTLKQRVEAKSRETGWSPRTIHRDLARYRDLGLWGLVDKRQTRLKRLNLDPRVHSAIEQALQELTPRSTVSHEEIRRRVQLELDREHGAGVVRCPPRSTFNRKLNELARGRGTFGVAAKARRSIANRPETPYRRFRATRPGEYVLIDSSRYDVYAIDPGSGHWITLELTIALDLYTRSIVAWRYTPKSAKGVDAALILHDIVAWKPMRPGWPESARWRYHGVPDTIIIDPEGGRDQADPPAGIPALYPETVVVDRGRIYLSQAFQDACTRLGISIQLARPYRPTDKSQIERTFRTIRESLLEKLPGYKGPDVHSRGERPEAEACLFVSELEELFAEWVASWWQVRHHDGLHLPGQPQIHLSPNEMYDEGIARWGLLYIPPSRTLYYELLPTAWRKLHHYGVDLNGLRYDGESLNGHRHRTSPHNGRHRGEWPVKYDPRDLSKIYFRDHGSGEWHELGWVGRTDPDRPFSDVTLRYAKQLIKERGSNTKNHTELELVLGDLLERAERNEPHGRAEQRLAAKGRVHGWQVGRDRGGAALVQLPELEDGDDPGALFADADFDPEEIQPMEMFDPDHGFEPLTSMQEQAR